MAPIKKLTILQLELCRAHLSQLLHLVRLVLEIPLTQLYAWTDSTVVLNCMAHRKPKVLQDMWVSNIVELIGPERWCQVKDV